MTPRRRVAIGDIHGRTCWRKLLQDPFDEAYFVGDYFDDYDETPTSHQVVNFLHIVRLARSNPNVHLCLGNHDYHYLRGLDFLEKYSGFQNVGYWDINVAIESAMDVIRPVYVTDDRIIVSHAGVTSTFLRECGLTDPLEINGRFLEYRMALAHVQGNREGDDPRNGPIWVRPKSLLADKVPGYRQIVGHTRFDAIHEEDGVTFIDVLESIEKAYIF